VYIAQWQSIRVHCCFSVTYRHHLHTTYMKKVTQQFELSWRDCCVFSHSPSHLLSIQSEQRCWQRVKHTYISLMVTNIRTVNCIVSTLCALSSGDLIMPRIYWQIGNRAFSVVAPRAWNRLPTDMIDRLISAQTENILIWDFIWTPGNGLTLWCTLGHLVGGTVQMCALVNAVIVCCLLTATDHEISRCWRRILI